MNIELSAAGVEAVMPDARSFNRSAVARLARDRGVVTRADLAGTLGLHKATVSRVVRELLEERVLLEGPTVASARAGRSTTSLIFNPAAAAVLTVEVFDDLVKVTEADGRGVVLRQQEYEPRSGDRESMRSDLRAAATRIAAVPVSAVTVAASMMKDKADSGAQAVVGDVVGVLSDAGLRATVRPLGEMGALGARATLAPGPTTFAFVVMDRHIEFAYSSVRGVMQGTHGVLGCVELIDTLGLTGLVPETDRSEQLYRVCMTLDASYSPDEIVVAPRGLTEAEVRRIEGRIRESSASAPRVRVIEPALITNGCIINALTQTHAALAS